MVAFMPAALFCQTPVSIPSYHVLRMNEDWSALAEGESSRKPDLFDPIKFIPVNDSGSVWLSFGGHLRVRAETWSNFDLSDQSANDDTFGLGRALLHVDSHFGRDFRVFVEGKAATSTDRSLWGGRRSADIDEGDLLNAFVEVSKPLSDSAAVSFRAGRQQFLFGRQRLIGPSAWGNVIRSFDGFSATVGVCQWNLTGLWARPVVVNKYAFNRADPNAELTGVHTARNLPQSQLGLKFYWFALDRRLDRDSDPATQADGEKRHTIGGRAWGEAGSTGTDYEAEMAYQFGTLGSDEIGAYFVATQIGYRFEQRAGSPHPYLGFDYASGDGTLPGKAVTFDPLFPTPHGFLGLADVLGRMNVGGAAAGVALQPLRRFKVDISAHRFWRASTRDALYDAGGRAIRPAISGASKSIGSELDLLFQYKLGRHVDIGLTASRFFRGEFVTQTGPAVDLSVIYFWIQYTF